MLNHLMTTSSVPFGTTSINWTSLPHSATQAHILPKLGPQSLISIHVLCDHNCTVIFDKHNITIEHNNHHILHSPCLPNGLWSLPLHSPQPQATPSSQPTHKKTLYNGSTLLPSALASAHFLMQSNTTSLPQGQTLPPTLSVTTCVLLLQLQKGTLTNNANDNENPPSMNHHHHPFLPRSTALML